jgi:hypothetical protein
MGVAHPHPAAPEITLDGKDCAADLPPEPRCRHPRRLSQESGIAATAQHGSPIAAWYQHQELILVLSTEHQAVPCTKKMAANAPPSSDKNGTISGTLEPGSLKHIGHHRAPLLNNYTELSPQMST